MTAVGCGTVEINPPQHSIKQREKCGLAKRKGVAARWGLKEVWSKPAARWTKTG
jgi:hypothetical protein